MAEVTSIRPADLRKIQSNLGPINDDYRLLDKGVD